MGDNISGYLQKNAWKDDCEHNTKVFLVRDKKTRQIAFYFSLNCGILYEELNQLNLKDNERKVFENYVNKMKKNNKNLIKNMRRQ